MKKRSPLNCSADRKLAQKRFFCHHQKKNARSTVKYQDNCHRSKVTKWEPYVPKIQLSSKIRPKKVRNCAQKMDISKVLPQKVRNCAQKMDISKD